MSYVFAEYKNIVRRVAKSRSHAQIFLHEN